MTEPSTATLRRDAVRNRERVLAAAERVLAERGAQATMGEIAAAAGVGVGTLYRRFGSKDALVEAIFRDRIADFRDVIQAAVDEPVAWDGLVRLLRHYVDSRAQGLVALQLGREIAAPATRVLQEIVVPGLVALVERAKAEGALRADFAATDIPVLTHAVAAIAVDLPRGGIELAHRHLELLLKGLGPTPDPVPVPPPLADEDFVHWIRAVR